MRYRIYVSMILVLSFLIGCGNDNNTNPVDNNIESVTIGSQVWMKKNLDVDHYRNGDPIPEVQDSAQWANLTTGTWCYYNNSDSLGQIYGKLYNWYAVNDPRGLAPNGWHVPSIIETNTLFDYLGGQYKNAGKLKEAGNTHWKSPNLDATNQSFFSALPGGCCHYYEWGTRRFSGIGFNGFWWNSTEIMNTHAYLWNINYNSADVSGKGVTKKGGFSVRCLRN